MKLATMADPEALIIKLRSNILRKRLNAMIWYASTQGMRPPVLETLLHFDNIS